MPEDLSPADEPPTAPMGAQEIPASTLNNFAPLGGHSLAV